MKIVPVFAPSTSLCAMQYAGQSMDELHRLLHLWQRDIDFLESFFEENEELFSP